MHPEGLAERSEASSIDANNKYVERQFSVRKDLPHNRESGRTIDRTTSACEPERAIEHTRPFLSMA